MPRMGAGSHALWLATPMGHFTGCNSASMPPDSPTTTLDTCETVVAVLSSGLETSSSACCGHWLEPPYGSRCGSRPQETPERPPPPPGDTHSPSALGSRVLLPATSAVTGSTGFPEHFSFLHAW